MPPPEARRTLRDQVWPEQFRVVGEPRMVEEASRVFGPSWDTQPPPAGQMLAHAAYPGIVDVVIEEAWIFCDHAGAVFWSSVELVQEFAKGDYPGFTGPYPFHGFDQCIWPQFFLLSSQLD